MKDYVSVTHVTSNEDGKEELALETSVPLWVALTSALFNRPCGATKTDYYVVDGTRWVEKFTGKTPDADMQFELFECKGWVKRQDKLDEFFGGCRK